MRVLTILRKSMLSAGAGVNAAEFAGGRALQPETKRKKNRRKRIKRRKRTTEEGITTETVARALAAYVRACPRHKHGGSPVRLM